MAGKRNFYEEQTPDWVETVSLAVDCLGLSTILFLTGMLVVRCFF